MHIAVDEDRRDKSPPVGQPGSAHAIHVAIEGVEADIAAAKSQILREHAIGVNRDRHLFTAGAVPVHPEGHSGGPTGRGIEL